TRQAAALGGVATATAGATVLLGYAFREPLFSAEDGVIPIAPSTGLAFACCGLAIACSAGADVWPLRLYFGQELRQRLTRAFLPATAGLVVLVSWAMAWVVPLFGGNAAIAAAVMVGASLLLIGLVVSRVALSISAVLQETERERLEARDGEHRAKARADSVLACVGQGLCGVDLEGLITFMNPAATELFGIAESDATSGAHHSHYFHRQQSSLER